MFFDTSLCAWVRISRCSSCGGLSAMKAEETSRIHAASLVSHLYSIGSEMIGNHEGDLACLRPTQHGVERFSLFVLAAGRWLSLCTFVSKTGAFSSPQRTAIRTGSKTQPLRTWLLGAFS